MLYVPSLSDSSKVFLETCPWLYLAAFRQSSGDQIPTAFNVEG